MKRRYSPKQQQQRYEMGAGRRAPDKRSLPVCGRCHKVTFRSEGQAEVTIEFTDGVAGVRAYPCPTGYGWHLTKRDYAF